MSTLRAEATQPGFETAYARVNVLVAPSDLRILVESGAGQNGSAGEPLPQPVVVRVLDGNRVPYSGVPLEITGSGDSVAVGPDENRPRWPGDHQNGKRGRLIRTFSRSRYPTPMLTPSCSRALRVSVRPFRAEGVVNAADLASSGPLAPGSLATLFGANLAELNEAAPSLPLPRELAGVRLFVNGAPVAAAVRFAGAGQLSCFHSGLAARRRNARGERADRGQSGPVEGRPRANVEPGDLLRRGELAAAAIRFNVRRVEPPAQRSAVAGEFIGGLRNRAGTRSTTRPPPASRLRASFSRRRCSNVRRSCSTGSRSRPRMFSGLAPTFSGLYQVNVQTTRRSRARPTLTSQSKLERP